MLVVMEAAARPEQIEAVVRHIERMGFRAHPIPGAFRTAIGITGHSGKANPQILENFPGVKEVIPVSHAYKLVSREAKPDDFVVVFGSDSRHTIDYYRAAFAQGHNELSRAQA